MLTEHILFVMQIFGKDNVLTLGGETAESRQQWAEDMDTDVRFVMSNDQPESRYLLPLVMMTKKTL